MCVDEAIIDISALGGALNEITFLICIKMFILKLQARNTEKLLQANIFYQNKDVNKSNVCKVILSQIRLQRLNLDKSALVDIFTNVILK